MFSGSARACLLRRCSHTHSLCHLPDLQVLGPSATVNLELNDSSCDTGYVENDLKLFFKEGSRHGAPELKRSRMLDGRDGLKDYSWCRWILTDLVGQTLVDACRSSANQRALGRNDIPLAWRTVTSSYTHLNT
jgi:hypothetical protein